VAAHRRALRGLRAARKNPNFTALATVFSRLADQLGMSARRPHPQDDAPTAKGSAAQPSHEPDRRSGIWYPHTQSAAPANGDGHAAQSTLGVVAQREGLWMAVPDGILVSLRTRTTLARLLRSLGEARVAVPGVSRSPGDLIADVWPGEKIIPKAARNRLHVAIRTLRVMGLERVLLSDDDGYRLDPKVPFTFVSEP
jgi:hypothetical protein